MELLIELYSNALVLTVELLIALCLTALVLDSKAVGSARFSCAGAEASAWPGASGGWPWTRGTATQGPNLGHPKVSLGFAVSCIASRYRRRLYRVVVVGLHDAQHICKAVQSTLDVAHMREVQEAALSRAMGHGPLGN